MLRIFYWLQRTETQSKQLWQLMNSFFFSHTHTDTTSDLFSLYKWQPWGQQQCSSSSYCTPAHTFSSDICIVCLFTSKHPGLITALAIGAKHEPPHNPLYKITLTLITGESLPPLTIMVLTLPPGFYEVMKSLIVHSQWPWAPREWIGLLNNWDVECKCAWQINDETKPVFGPASKDTAAGCLTL